MESSEPLYAAWKSHYRHARNSKPGDLNNLVYGGRRNDNESSLSLSELGHDLLYLARKAWPTIADELRLLDQVDGWLRVDKGQTTEQLEALNVSTVNEWLKSEAGCPPIENKCAIGTAEALDEIVASLRDGMPVNEVYGMLKQLSLKGGCELVLDGTELVLTTNHPTIDYEHTARIDTEKPMADDDKQELSKHLILVLSAWARELRRESPEQAGADDTAVELRKDNGSRTVLELLQFLTFFDNAKLEVATWRDKAGYNGFRQVRFKHELDENPIKRLKQWQRVVVLLQENLALWPNIVRLRTMAEAEDKSLNADWFRQWKARRAIELDRDSVDDRLLADVFASGSQENEPPGEQAEAISQSDGDGGARLPATKVPRKRNTGGRKPEPLTADEKKVQRLWASGKGKFKKHNELDEYLDQDDGYTTKALDRISAKERRKAARSTKPTK